jgi:hypothetical protein
METLMKSIHHATALEAGDGKGKRKMEIKREKKSHCAEMFSWLLKQEKK